MFNPVTFWVDFKKNLLVMCSNVIHVFLVFILVKTLFENIFFSKFSDTICFMKLSFFSEARFLITQPKRVLSYELSFFQPKSQILLRQNVLILKVFILIHNQLLSTANAKDNDTYLYYK